MFNFFGHLKWKMSCPQERASICESKSLSSVKFGLFISKLWQNSKPIYHFSGGHISKSFGSIAFFTLTASFWDKLVSYPPWKEMDEYISELIIFNNSIISQQHQFFARVDVWFLIYDYNKKKLSTSRRNKSNIHYESKNDWFKANPKNNCRNTEYKYAMKMQM